MTSPATLNDREGGRCKYKAEKMQLHLQNFLFIPTLTISFTNARVSFFSSEVLRTRREKCQIGFLGNFESLAHLDVDFLYYSFAGIEKWTIRMCNFRDEAERKSKKNFSPLHQPLRT